MLTAWRLWAENSLRIRADGANMSGIVFVKVML